MRSANKFITKRRIDHSDGYANHRVMVVPTGTYTGPTPCSWTCCWTVLRTWTLPTTRSVSVSQHECATVSTVRSDHMSSKRTLYALHAPSHHVQPYRITNRRTCACTHAGRLPSFLPFCVHFRVFPCSAPHQTSLTVSRLPQKSERYDSETLRRWGSEAVGQ